MARLAGPRGTADLEQGSEMIGMERSRIAWGAGCSVQGPEGGAALFRATANVHEGDRAWRRGNNESTDQRHFGARRTGVVLVACAGEGEKGWFPAHTVWMLRW